jgi:PilZ domain
MSSKTDRRIHDRYTVDPMYSAVSVHVIPSRGRKPADAGSVLEGHVYEISLGGMRFELDEPLLIGTRVGVSITLVGCPAPIVAEAKVMRVFDQVDDPGARRMVVAFESFAAGSREMLERHFAQNWLRRAPVASVEDQDAFLTCEVMIEASEPTSPASPKASRRKSASAA